MDIFHLLAYLPLITKSLIFSLPIPHGNFIRLCFVIGLSFLGALKMDANNFGLSFFEYVSSIFIYSLHVMPIFFLVRIGESLGELIDVARGQSIGFVLNPINKRPQLPIANFITSYVETIFFSSVVLPFLVLLFFKSYEDLETFSILGVIKSISKAVYIVFDFAMPFLLAFILSDIIIITLSIIVKGANFIRELIVLRSIVAYIILILCITRYATEGYMKRQFILFFKDILN